MCMAAKPTDADGNEIKAAMSGWMLFCNNRRTALTAELKASMGAEFKTTAVLTGLGAEWKALSEGDKAPFSALAIQDKERYESALASNPANKKKVKKSGPKKLSAYMHFCNSRRTALTAELKASMGAEFKNTAVMSGLGAEWKTLSEGDKAPFAAMALIPVE